jgi:hypothetical protein
MVERGKHHPSVSFWSFGNELGDGANPAAACQWVKQRNPTRLFHNEGSTSNGGRKAPLSSFMYPTLEHTAEHARNRPEMPLILCTYTHAMGNSYGGLARYWDILYSDTSMRGGFVWDWVDQRIRQPVPPAHREACQGALHIPGLRRLVGRQGGGAQRRRPGRPANRRPSPAPPCRRSRRLIPCPVRARSGNARKRRSGSSPVRPKGTSPQYRLPAAFLRP